MDKNLFQARRMAPCLGACAVLAVAMAAVAPTARAQGVTEEVFLDLGRLGLQQMQILQPSMIYRPVDATAGRPGGDALGMGGAYLASASGAMALGWNAAGLADLEKLSFAFDGYSRSASSSTGDFPDSLIVSGFSTLHFLNYGATRKGGFVPNYLAAGVPLWTSGERRLVAAFGWRHYAETARPEQTISELVAGGAGNTFPVVFSFDRSEKGSLEAFSPALAFRLGPRVSMGATLNILDGGVRATTDERFTIVGMPLQGIIRTRHSYSGISPEFGVRLSAQGPAGWPLAGAFRMSPGYTLEVRDGAFYSRSIAVPGQPRYITEGTIADYDLSVPQALGAGVAVRPTSRLLLAADWNRQMWSETKVEYTRHAQGAPDHMGLPLADVTSWHAGAEYTLLRRHWGDLPVRVGFRTAPQGYLDPNPRDVRADTLETDAGRMIYAVSNGQYYGEQPEANAYSFGVSLVTPTIRYDLGFETVQYEHTKWFFETPYDMTINPGMAMIKVDQTVNKLRLSVSYRL